MMLPDSFLGMGAQRNLNSEPGILRSKVCEPEIKYRSRAKMARQRGADAG